MAKTLTHFVCQSCTYNEELVEAAPAKRLAGNGSGPALIYVGYRAEGHLVGEHRRAKDTRPGARVGYAPADPIKERRDRGALFLKAHAARL